MKTQLENLRNLMEKYELFQQDDEVGIALKELEKEVESYQEFTIWKEDFTDESLESEVIFDGGSLTSKLILFK
jgi:hypothetical protein